MSRCRATCSTRSTSATRSPSPTRPSPSSSTPPPPARSPTTTRRRRSRSRLLPPGGRRGAHFNVTLSAPARAVRVNYATANGTRPRPATTPRRRHAMFAPGQTTKPVTVSSAEDALDEADETFTLGLSGAPNATVGDPSGMGTITDDDPTPSLVINDSSRRRGRWAHSFTVTSRRPAASRCASTTRPRTARRSRPATTPPRAGPGLPARPDHEAGHRQQRPGRDR